MVGPDEILDHAGETVLPRDGHAVLYMTDDVAGAVPGRFPLMITDRTGGRGFILHKAERILHLAKVVVEGADPQQRHVRIHGTADGIRHVHHLEAVLEGSGGLGGELLQQRAVRIRKLLEAGRRDQVEQAFEQVNQRIGGDGHHGPDKNLDHIEDHRAGTRIHEAEAGEDDHFHPKDDQRIDKL